MNENASKPNILLLMADQMTVRAMSIYGNQIAKMPHFDHLAAHSVLFENAYCAAPLCAPARFAMLTGRQSVHLNAFDNASEFPASIPTMAHYLRGHGYSTTLCGKMHFIGPDQLHGFSERISTDVYPSTYAWVPHWDKGASYITSGVTCASILEAGPCIRSMQMDYDDEVEYRGTQKLYDLARADRQMPFFLTISFTHPHHPFTIGHDHWNRYSDADIDQPAVAEIPFESLDYHSRGLYFAHGRHLHKITPQHVRNARHAYYGMMSYLDDKIGRLLAVLEETNLASDTLVIFTADHGEMLGERGMWHKHNFFEPSIRIPLMMRWPGRLEKQTIAAPVSHIDLLPTLVDLLGINDAPARFDGRSLLSRLQGDSAEVPVFADYLAIGPCVPCRMVRIGQYKYMYTHGHDEQLFDLAADPNEQTNIADKPECAQIKARLKSSLLATWDPEEVDQRVRLDQRRRIAINSTPGHTPRWDYIYRKGDGERFVRNRQVDRTKGKYQLPQTTPTPPNRPSLDATQIEAAMRQGILP